MNRRDQKALEFHYVGKANRCKKNFFFCFTYNEFKFDMSQASSIPDVCLKLIWTLKNVGSIKAQIKFTKRERDSNCISVFNNWKIRIIKLTDNVLVPRTWEKWQFKGKKSAKEFFTFFSLPFTYWIKWTKIKRKKVKHWINENKILSIHKRFCLIANITKKNCCSSYMRQ